MGALSRAALAVVLAALLGFAGCAPGPEPTSKPAAPKPIWSMPNVVGLEATQAVEAIQETAGSSQAISIFSATKHGPIDIVEPDAGRPGSAKVTSQSPVPDRIADPYEIRIFLGPLPVAEDISPAVGPGWFDHSPTIKQNGAEPCFECHKETFCSDCHVNRRNGADSEGGPFMPEVNMLKGVGQKTLGLGSTTELGMRDVCFRDDRDGQTFTVEVTAPQSGSIEEADRYFAALGKAFVDAVERAPRLSQVERIEFAWFQQGSEIVALREVYRRKPRSGAFRRVVPYYEPNVSRFVN